MATRASTHAKEHLAAADRVVKLEEEEESTRGQVKHVLVAPEPLSHGKKQRGPGRVILLAEDEGFDSDTLENKIAKAHKLRQIARDRMAAMGDAIPPSLMPGSLGGIPDVGESNPPSKIKLAMHHMNKLINDSLDKEEATKQKAEEKAEEEKDDKKAADKKDADKKDDKKAEEDDKLRKVKEDSEA